MVAAHLAHWPGCCRRANRRWRPTHRRSCWRSAPQNGIYFSASHDEGKTFSPAVKVAEGAIVPLSRHRGPRIALSGNTIVITAVTGKKARRGYARARPALRWRPAGVALDGRREDWSTGIAINDVPGARDRRTAFARRDGKGTLFAAWLDKRGAKGTKLYGARSTDAGATWSKNVAGLSIARMAPFANAATPRWRSMPAASCW